MALAILLAAWPLAGAFAAGEPSITVYGTTGSASGSVQGLTAWLGGPDGRPIPSQDTDPRTGQWIARVERPGLYAAVVEEAHGFGPALRPGVTVREGEFNRVHIALPFQYELLHVGQPAAEAHREYGQQFVAAGTGITAIAFQDYQNVLITLHENDASGPQLGKAVAASSYYPLGTLPTVPGQRYYLRFARKDGAPFRMHVVGENRYDQGTAFLDGKRDSSLDLALRIQHNPPGQILRHKPGSNTHVFRKAERCYGQTFTAAGDGLAMLSVFPVPSGQEPTDPVIQIFESGPDGRPLGPPVSSRILVFNPGQRPLESGQKYYIQVCLPQSQGGLSMWTSQQDDFVEGELYVDGQAVRDRDLAMMLVEYESHKVAPTAPVTPDWRPGMAPYASRLTADGRAKLVWDLPATGDIAGVLIRRFLPGQSSDPSATGELIAQIAASSPGRHQYTDMGLTNGTTYRYTVCAVDAWGNESEPLKAPVIPAEAMPLPVELLNGDLSGPDDTGFPHGWQTRTISGAVPAFRLDRPAAGKNEPASAGWEVPEGAGHTDTVLCQRVPCEKGRRYRLSCEIRLWNPWNNREMIICGVAGVDPTGGADPLAEQVVWSSPMCRRSAWAPASTAAVAQSDHLTVYLRGAAQFSRLMNVRFRNVELEDVTHMP
jgi:hypothetical protein